MTAWFAAVHESVVGTEVTCPSSRATSDLGGVADFPFARPDF